MSTIMPSPEVIAELYERGEELARTVERATGATRGRALAALECVLRALDAMEGKRRLPRLPRVASVFGATRTELAGYGKSKRTPPRRPRDNRSADDRDSEVAL